jgi:hypothetical protein
MGSEGLILTPIMCRTDHVIMEQRPVMDERQNRLSRIGNSIIKQIKIRASEEDYESARESGWPCRWINGVMFVDLNNDEKVGDRCVWDLKVNEDMMGLIEKSKGLVGDNGHGVIPLMVIPEFGGYNSDQCYGVGQTVCGLSGKALRPFSTSNSVGRDHARFGIPGRGIICHANFRTDGRWDLTIYETHIGYNDGVIDFDVSVYWHGGRFNESTRKYMTCMAFSMAKATTLNCDAACYYDLGDSFNGGGDLLLED